MQSIVLQWPAQYPSQWISFLKYTYTWSCHSRLCCSLPSCPSFLPSRNMFLLACAWHVMWTIFRSFFLIVVNLCVFLLFKNMFFLVCASHVIRATFRSYLLIVVNLCVFFIFQKYVFIGVCVACYVDDLPFVSLDCCKSLCIFYI